MKIGFLITARMKSTRLPRKLTLKILGNEIIVWMIRRLKQVDIINDIIVATSTNPDDSILCELAEKEGINCFRGDEDDVLKRLYDAAMKFNLDYIINITGDCPLVDTTFIGKAIDEYKKTYADLLTTFKLPHGFFFYGIKTMALAKVLEIKKSSETEVWGKYFTDTGLFKVVDLEIPEEFQRKNFRLSLDYPEDFEFFKKVFVALGPETYKKSTKEIIEFLDNNPDIVAINESCEERYKARLDSQSKIELK